MDVDEVLSHARDAMTVKRVFGDPYEKDGVTVIPVAKVMGGAGAGGSGAVPAPAGAGRLVSGDATGEEAARAGTPESGYGMGYGLRASPAGVYVIKGGEVEWKPAVDVGRLALQRAGVAIIALLVLRSIIRTLARR